MKIVKGFFGTTFELTSEEVAKLTRGEELTVGDITIQPPAVVPQHDSGDETDFLYGFSGGFAGG